MSNTKKIRTKDFGSDLSVDDFDPLVFTLCGQEFNCRRAIQGKDMLDLITATTADNGVRAAQAAFGFFEIALLPEDYTRFQELLNSDTEIISVQKLSEITAWLIEEYTARPTEPQSDSSDGLSASGPA